MEDATLNGIAQTISDRGEADYDDVREWMNMYDIDSLLDGFDIDVLDWYFDTLAGEHSEALGDYPNYPSEIGKAVDRVSDTFREKCPNAYAAHQRRLQEGGA